MARRVWLRGGLIRHPYNPRYGRFMPERAPYLEGGLKVLEHPGISQSVWLDALEV